MELSLSRFHKSTLSTFGKSGAKHPKIFGDNRAHKYCTEPRTKLAGFCTTFIKLRVKSGYNIIYKTI